MASTKTNVVLGEITDRNCRFGPVVSIAFTSSEGSDESVYPPSLSRAIFSCTPDKDILYFILG